MMIPHHTSCSIKKQVWSAADLPNLFESSLSYRMTHMQILTWICCAEYAVSCSFFQNNLKKFFSFNHFIHMRCVARSPSNTCVHPPKCRKFNKGLLKSTHIRSHKSCFVSRIFCGQFFSVWEVINCHFLKTLYTVCKNQHICCLYCNKERIS